MDNEVSRIPDDERRQKVAHLSAMAEAKVTVDETVEARAEALAKLGFSAYDALHIACAEAGNAEVLLTTDDRMWRRARRHRDALRVSVENPTLWLMEVTANGNPEGNADGA